MKALYALVFVFFCNLSLANEPGTDKVAHGAVSYAGSYTCGVLTKKPIPCALVTLAIGVAKEFAIDSMADKNDIIADGVGVGASLIVIQF